MWNIELPSLRNILGMFLVVAYVAGMWGSVTAITSIGALAAMSGEGVSSEAPAQPAVVVCEEKSQCVSLCCPVLVAADPISRTLRLDGRTAILPTRLAALVFHHFNQARSPPHLYPQS